jgi:AbrB family looped-hinge helix DNA binding protein
LFITYNLWDILKTWYTSAMDYEDRFTIALGDRGRLVLPARLRRRLDLHPGDRLVLAPERSLVDELIAERRAEAQRDDAS